MNAHYTVDHLKLNIGALRHRVHRLLAKY